MLQIIRDRAQGLIVWTIVGLIIITFALFGLGSYLSGSTAKGIASVDGKDIKQDDFQRAYRNYQDRLRQMLGASYRADMFDAAMVKKEVLKGLINQRLLTEYLDAQKIYPADQLIAGEIHGIPAFKNEKGEFSAERYQEWLQQRGMSPAGFEANLARDIASQQVAGALNQTAFITPKELALYQRLKYQQRDIGYLLLKKAAYLGEVKISDENIKKYYQTHQQEFMTKERVKLNYVDLDLAKRAADIPVDETKLKEYYKANRKSYLKQAEQRRASHILITVNKDTDDAAAKAKLNAILAEYKAGKSFAELAKKNSQDPGSAKQGGDLGFFARGAMDKAFEDSAFALKKGEVSQPVKSRFGYHLILVTAIKPAEYRPYKEVKAQIKHQLQMAAVEQQFYVDAEKLDNLSYDHPNSLDSILDQLGLTLLHSDFFGRQGGRGLFANPKIIKAAYSDEVLNQGLNSAVIEISSTHLIVLRLAAHQAAKLKPLTEVKAAISKRLQGQAAQQLAAKDAETALTAIRAGSSPAAWSRENKKGQWKAIGFVSRAANLDPVAAKDKKIVLTAGLREKAFELPQPTSGKPGAEVMTLADGDVAVLLVYKVKDVDAKEKMTAEYRQQLQSALGSADYNHFIQELGEGADIKIHMENIQE